MKRTPQQRDTLFEAQRVVVGSDPMPANYTTSDGLVSWLNAPIAPRSLRTRRPHRSLWQRARNRWAWLWADLDTEEGEG